MKKLGFIGCGNMAGAIIGGVLKGGLFDANEIIVSDISAQAVEKIRETYQIEGTGNNTDVVKKAGIILLAVKPQFYESVIREIAPLVSESQIIMTIAAGWTLKRLEEAFGKPVKIVRCMPNTPALVQSGFTSVCCNEQVTEEEFLSVKKILESFGISKRIPENLFDTASAICGCSPACIYMLIEAMGDAAVYGGISRNDAYEMAAQALIGSAKMVLETGGHPGYLKDMVCSPAGSTIEAVRVLEEKGFRSSMFEAMLACADKSGKL